VLQFALSPLDNGSVALTEEASATGVWLVKTTAFGRSADEDFGTGDWLVETAAPGS
jgi:hypothetical protein